MKKRLLASFLSLVLILGLLPTAAMAAENSDSIIISTVEDLQKIGNDDSYPVNGNYVLTTNIDLSSVGSWTPIGDESEPFTGTFDGQGYTISNLNINDSELDYAGLFGRLSTPGVLKNIVLENVTITARAQVGALAGSAYTGTVQNCTVQGTINITGNYKVGGLAGEGYAKMENCHVIGDAGSSVTGVYQKADLEGDNVAGLVGYRGEGNIVTTNCTVSGLTVTGTRKVGGLIGTFYMNNTLSGCAASDVTVATNATAEYAESKTTTLCVGGLFGILTKNGNNGGNVSNCIVEDVELVNTNNVAQARLGYISGGVRDDSWTTVNEFPVPQDGELTISAVYALGTNTGSNVPASQNDTTGALGGMGTKPDAVARVNGTLYTSLSDAIGAATNGETITLLKSIELEQSLSSGTNTVLDLAGYTITAPESSYIIVVAENQSFTLNDSSEEGTGALAGGTGDNSHAGAVTVQNGGSFTMNGGNITGNTGTTSGAGVSLGLNSTFTMTGGSITDNTATTNLQSGVCANRQSTVTISGNVNITGNTGNDFGDKVDSDLWLDTLNGATLTIGEDGLDPSARIGVYVNGGVYDDAKTFTGAYQSGKATTNNFISNRTKYYVVEVEVEGGVAAAMSLYPSAAPTASPEPGAYVGPQTVTLSTTTWPTLTKIYYTTDGSDPKTSETTQTYTEPLTIEATTTIKAYTSGLYGDYVSSDVVELIYTITSPSSPSTGGTPTYAITAPSNVTGGEVSVSPSRASYSSTVTITVDPDEGYELDELTVTDANGNEIAVRSRGNNQYTFTMPRSRVTIEATFAEIVEEPALVFVDVPAGEYYYDAVYWAVENGVTNGTTATTFTPDRTVTRAEMVTFLWRAYGSPEPRSSVNPFTDVSSNAYYYDAVLWAVENGVTFGTSATTFSPEVTVTRAQAVTFQWRAASSPAVTGGSFADVEADAYYAGAVTWAVANGVTNGTGGNNFSPDVGVSRAQAVTFLYRQLG